MLTWLIDTLVWSGALIALVLVLRRPVARLCGAGIAYALWLLPLVRLAVPPLVLPAWLAPAETAAPVAPAGADETIAISLAAPAASGLVLPWELLLTSAWLGGAALFLVARVIEYREMRARLLAAAVTVDLREGVRIVETPAVDAPVAFGVRDKVIAVPPRFVITGALAERELALQHELAHHRGRDLLANMLAQGLLALHWFNPLAWAAWSAMRRDQEAACDARAMAGRDLPTRAAYARVIASFAAGPRLNSSSFGRAALAAPMACPVLGDKSIVHRLRSLTMNDISPRRMRAARWLLGAGAALALPLTATIVYAGPDEAESPSAKKSLSRVEKRVTIVDARDGASPDDASLHTRTVVRDGTTIVLKTRTPLSDAEAEARIADAEANLWETESRQFADRMAEAPTPPQPPEPPYPAEPPLPPEAPQVPQEHREIRKIVMHRSAGHEGSGSARAMRDCGSVSALADVNVASDKGESERRGVNRTRVLLCAKAGAAKSAALAGVRQARASIAGNRSMDDEIRREVLRELDQTIADMEQEAG